MLLAIFYFVISALTAKCTTQTQTCEAEKCEMVGETEICTRCQTGKVPIDGKCVDATANANCKNASGDGDANQVCGKCIGANFFMYKGGCYGKTGTPGSTICKTGGSTAGVCDTCEVGYFKSTAAAADKQSCIACNEPNTIDTFKGVSNCKVCDAPTKAGAATCTTCEDGYFGEACTKCHESCRTCEAAEENKCKSCTDGYFLGATNGAAGKCLKCNSKTEEGWHGVDNCAKCTSSNTQNTPATCTECVADFYLKPAAGATPSSCVAETGCGEGFFPTTVDGVKKCIGCSDNANGGIDKCAKCTLKTPAPEAGVKVICSECDSQKKLSPLKDACMDSCPAGTYDKQNVCTPCHSSCASCTDATSTTCTACYPGFVLSAASGASAGTCIQECTGKYAENCADGQCTAVVGGSKYCSRCKAGYAPVDGVCVPITQRTIAGCNPGQDGTCTSCKDAYFKESGGCYQSTTYPGNKLCTTASQGKCTNCANGQAADSNSGSCPACDPTCAACTEANKPDKCSACPPGRYLDSTAKACKLCTENSNNIQGVVDCVSCAPPAGNSGPVTCYVKKDGTDDGGNDNKSGLSTGAIAGISVAVIVVVGGLIGFLCWWFICRGKA